MSVDQRRVISRSAVVPRLSLGEHGLRGVGLDLMGLAWSYLLLRGAG